MAEAARPAFLIDIDGTLYDGDRAIAGASEAIDFLRRNELPFLLVTNTTRISTQQVHARLEDMGFDIGERQIFAAPAAACRYMRNKIPGASCFAIAAENIDDELTRAGLTVVRREQPVDFVVISQFKWISFGELDIAQRLIAGGAEAVSLHKDLTYPENGIPRISLGAAVAALEAVTGTAVTIIGKPNRQFFELALETAGISRAAATMVGDDLRGDIRGAAGAGLRAIQVRTGSYRAEDETSNPAEAILDSVADLPRWILDRHGSELAAD